MHVATDLVYDSSMAIDVGRRERQEDAVASDFSTGQDFGFVVLADGMGGHAAGDVASKIVVTEVFSELKLQSGDPDVLEGRLADILRGAAQHANECVAHYAQENPNVDGMGATLLAPVLIEDRLYWISVGDSPLYLFRNGELSRLNENHALGAQIEFLVASGLMDREEAMAYPDQTCLTSVLVGRDIAQIDCRVTPLTLMEGDILIAASDGLLFLSEEQIEGVIRFKQKRTAKEISNALMDELQALDDPCQDNIALCVIKAMRKGTAMVPSHDDMSLARTRTGNGETITILARVRKARQAAAQG